MDKCGLYLGCNIPFKAPDIEQSLYKVFPALGVEVVDMDGASCCPAWGTAPSFDVDTWLSVSGRNITIAEDQNVDIMTGCNSCFGVLSEAKHMIDHNMERKKTLNKNLEGINRKYKGSSEVYHISHILHRDIGVDRIGQSLKYTLKHLKIAVQPGCHVLWPSDMMAVKEENSFEPTLLKDLCQALEADVPEYSRLNACCGMGAMKSTDQKRSIGLLKEKLLSIKQEADPDMIVTTCSSCFLQLDSGQQSLKKSGDIDFEIPVFYYSQLLALCMGFKPEQVACISETPRDAIIKTIQSNERLTEVN
ncbi:MAG: CoB--CoM heterodisulfide reductase iron-sulfur subunit B family protein [Desulfobacter sp.]|nr:CoB--CoM heterodisulfide reductase iron-sulfur subunit B family protein [Desulfobacter sp.]WDP87519.1 MAG: CoB--CoM heterodisulfide reductase iron-sulfur subunit B family protein [Desulfobacter sp.]